MLPIDKQYLIRNIRSFKSVILDPAYIIQYATLPVASEDYEGVIYQYTGSASGMTLGGFYQCQEITPSTSPKTYHWVEITTKTAIDGVTIRENANDEIYVVDATSLAKGIIKLGDGLDTDANGATNVVDRVIVASLMPTAAAALDGNVYLYCGTTTTTAPIYQKGYLYKCQESSTTGVYEFVQIGLHADGDTIEVDSNGALSVNKAYRKIYNGSSTDWGLLSTQQKTEYDYTAFSDEDEAGVETVVDAITDGDMHAVTSNAVYDACSIKVSTALGSGDNFYHINEFPLSSKETFNLSTLYSEMPRGSKYTAYVGSASTFNGANLPGSRDGIITIVKITETYGDYIEFINNSGEIYYNHIDGGTWSGWQKVTLTNV